MATYTKVIPSASTNGKPVIIAVSGSPGTLFHTAVTGTSDLDEIWMYLTNITDSDIVVTLEWGEAEDHIIGNAPSKSGLILVAPGILLQNSLTVKAFADTVSGVYLHGFVNRIEA